MAQLRESIVDPLTGETRKWWFDGDKLVRTREIDLKPTVSTLKEQAKATPGFRKGKPLHKVASIPAIVIEKLMKDHNLDVFNADDNEMKRLERIIEQEYPYLKTIEKRLWIPR